jgi:O-antigen/teichoic acid export membrane protein
MIVLGFGSIVNVMMGLNREVLTMSGHEAVVFRLMGWSTLMNVVLNAIFITLFGVVGAAVATSFTIMIWNIWLHFECHRTIGYSVAVFSRRIAPPKLTSP